MTQARWTSKVGTVLLGLVGCGCLAYGAFMAATPYDSRERWATGAVVLGLGGAAVTRSARRGKERRGRPQGWLVVLVGVAAVYGLGWDLLAVACNGEGALPCD